ncbi:chalcone isomerase family protein [Sedimenticola selenatireducens]|uniref:chalcone isomerase family protein n=1 Tax=Sedimenticola selenatireducens TaxID=191960 RepID=UPI0004AD5415|nr:chalcone isomerase family protein [Sedimenticola selenatireducens]
MKKMLRGVFGLLCLLTIFPLGAAELAKVTIPDRITLDGSDDALVLNGAGIRYKFIFKIYIGALYLPEKTSASEEIINSTGPKRILMHFLYDKVEKQDLDKAWREGFLANQDEQAMAQLDQRINRFSALFTDAVRGDEIWLDNIPDAGTRVYINGELKDTIPGSDFYPALLSIWIGSDPVTTALKRAMLGQE